MKRAIIIGASSGIGAEMAKQLSSKGYQLGLMARRGNLLEDLVSKLEGQHQVMPIDLKNFEEAEQQMNQMIALLDDVDLIVLNSGVGAQEYQLDWTYQKQVIDVNVSLSLIHISEPTRPY